MKLRSLEKIDSLTEPQRHQLADWLESETLDQCVQLVKREFGSEIPRSTLNRFRKRCELSDFLDTSPESARARAELINAAASGKPNFSQATVDLLEKQSFELADDTRNPESLRALKDLFGLVIKHRNTTVRERMATVQERKTKIREDEFALKKAEKEQPRESEEAYAIRLSAIFDHVFRNHPAIKAAESSIPLGSSPDSETLTQETLSESSSQTSLNPEPCSSRREEALTENPLSSPDPTPASEIPDDPGEVTSLLSTALNDTGNERSPVQSAIRNPHSAILVSHAIRRWRAYLPRPHNSPEPDPSWRDECPCGHPLPCSDHLDLHLSTRYLKPHHAEYASALEQAGIAYHIPTAEELGCSEEFLKKIGIRFSPSRSEGPPENRSPNEVSLQRG